jgi:hypothetical protein
MLYATVIATICTILGADRGAVMVAPNEIVSCNAGKCTTGLYTCPGSGFGVFFFNDDAMGSSLGIVKLDPEDWGLLGPSGWTGGQRFWEDAPWAHDVTSFMWSASGTFLYVATSIVSGKGEVYELDLLERKARCVLPATNSECWLIKGDGRWLEVAVAAGNQKDATDVKNKRIPMQGYVLDASFTHMGSPERTISTTNVGEDVGKDFHHPVWPLLCILVTPSLDNEEYKTAMKVLGEAAGSITPITACAAERPKLGFSMLEESARMLNGDYPGFHALLVSRYGHVWREFTSLSWLEGEYTELSCRHISELYDRLSRELKTPKSDELDLPDKAGAKPEK